MSRMASEGDDFEPWNHLEVAHICGGHAVAKLQCSHSNQQVREGDADALCRALAVDPSSAQSDWNRYRMHR